jgi:hypothetical protein
MKKTMPGKARTGARKAVAMKLPSSKPKLRRVPAGQAKLLPILEWLAQSVERLAQAAERLAESALHGSGTQPSPPANPAVEALHRHVDEHADDVEVARASRE